MTTAGRTYRLTESGRAASSGDDLSVPGDYRRILALVSADTHFDVIRGALRRYPDKLIAEWVEELEEIGYIEAVPTEADFDLDFTKFFAKPAAQAKVTGEDAKRIQAEAVSAEAVLARAGAWIAEDRLKNRPVASKPAAETTVLIVEDDPDQLALADLRISMAGYRVRTAGNARQLLDDLRAQPLPDILLLDVMLPDGDGFDILAKLRKHPKFALLLVAMLTAKDEPHEIAKGLALGADAYVTKPYSKSVLADTIGRILKVR
ncbi:MAG: response regulator [Proteobacteria bacterium]|nr:response regulator [Pseudomonadota bacterium]